MPRLLVVDDDRPLAQFIADVLERELFEVEVVHDGDSAQSWLKSHSFDLIILDWNLPYCSGIELATSFRETGGNTPILMLTGKQEITDKGEGFAAGVDDYLVKPFDHRELIMRVKALLKRPTELPGLILKLGDVFLDREKFRVRKSGTELSLTRTEFRLLEYFMQHPEQVFSQEALLDRVWSMEADASVDALRNCIVRLRRKLGENSSPRIETVRGLGYRISAQ